MQTYGRIPVAFVRGEGTRLWDSDGQRVPRLPRRARGHVARPRAPRGRRRRSRTRRARCCTSRTCTTTRCSRSSPNGSTCLLTSATGTPGRVFFANSGRRGQRVRDQARPPARPGARRARALPCALGVQLVPRPHAHHAGRDRPARRSRRRSSRCRPASARSSSRISTRSRPRWTSGSARSCSRRSRARAGCSPRRPATSKAVRRLCDEREALLIIDEVQTGLGRTGSLVRVRARRRRPSRRGDDGQGARQRPADRRVLGPHRTSPRRSAPVITRRRSAASRSPPVPRSRCST